MKIIPSIRRFLTSVLKTSSRTAAVFPASAQSPPGPKTREAIAHDEWKRLCERYAVAPEQPRKIRERILRKYHAGGGFIDCYIEVLAQRQRKRLAVVERERLHRAAQLVKRAQKSEMKTLGASLFDPVSRLAGEAEHAHVLAGSISAVFYRSPEWRAARTAALRLSGHRCALCGVQAREERLHVSHIVARLAAPDRAFDILNLRVVCEPCRNGVRADGALP